MSQPSSPTPESVRRAGRISTGILIAMIATAVIMSAVIAAILVDVLLIDVLPTWG